MNIFSVLTMIGGLAMFLYGMDAMGDGLAKLSGGKLEQILEKLTSKRIMAVLLGIFICDHGHGSRICKFRYYAAFTGGGNHHGCKRRNNGHFVDSFIVRHSGIEPVYTAFETNVVLTGVCSNRYCTDHDGEG